MERDKTEKKDIIFVCQFLNNFFIATFHDQAVMKDSPEQVKEIGIHCFSLYLCSRLLH